MIIHFGIVGGKFSSALGFYIVAGSHSHEVRKHCQKKRNSGAGGSGILPRSILVDYHNPEKKSVCPK